jgi:hypothetical protein
MTGGVPRVRPTGVIPLELWDLETGDGKILMDHLRTPTFPRVLLEALDALHAGRARARMPDTPLEPARGFGFLYVPGGGAEALAAAAADLETGRPWRARVAPDAFAGARGAEVLCPGPDTLVLDLGQTSLKASLDQRQARLPRGPDTRPGLRDSLCAGIAALGVAADRPPRAVVVALPCSLDDDGVPGSSTYTALEGDRDLVADVLARTGLSDVPALVLNDAELAALAASATCPAETATNLTLVLTIGHGVGGAVLLPAPRLDLASPRPMT